MPIASKQFRKYGSDGTQVEIGAIPIALQALTGATFANSQSFGSGTVENVTPPQDITGATFTNSQSFGSGVITQTSPQDIVGSSFTNTNQFGSGTISNGTVEDIDVAIPLLDRRTLRKLKKRFIAEESDRAARAKIRASFKPAPAEQPAEESRQNEVSDQAPDIAQTPPFVDAPQVDWALFDNLLSKLEIQALQSQRLALMKQMEKQQAIKQYEAIVQAEFQKAYQKEMRRQQDNKVLEMILPLLF